MTLNRGFTLIEVLIAMALLSVVMLVGSMGFSVFSQRWQNDMGSFSHELSQAKKLLLLQKAFNGIASYIVKNRQQQPVYLFQGSSRSVMFVSNAPLLQPAAQGLIWLEVITNDDGSDSLIYKEYSFIATPLFSLENLPQPNVSVEIFRAEDIRFNFYGWKDEETRARSFDAERVSPEWQTDYISERSGILPYAVNLSWAGNEPIIFPLPNDNANKLIYTNEKSTDA